MKKIRQKLTTFNVTLGVLLLAGIIFSIIQIVRAVDPNPGHIWSEIDDVALGETQGGTDQTTYTKGDILYADATDNLAKLGIGAGGDVLASVNGLPGWIATTTPVTVQTFTADGLYTPTAGMVKALYIVVGGGGAGASCTTPVDCCSGGGGGGGTAIKLVTAADVGANDSVEVGAQAASGSGGDQSLIGSVSASGGAVGVLTADTFVAGTSAAGGAGGVGSGGDLNIKGQAGGACTQYATTLGHGGEGGSSMFGGGGAGSISATNGGAGGVYGGGGGGCQTIDGTDRVSGVGAGGVVYVIEFFWF